MKASEYKCTVTSFKMLTPTVFELLYETDRPLEFKAGQFASVIIPGAGPKGRDLRRAYSIASGPEIRPIELCVKLVEGGPGTQYLYSLRPGDVFRSIAPYGDFIYKPKEGKQVCFVATGTGLAPFRSMIMSEQFKAHMPSTFYCLFGARTEDELLYDDLFGNYLGMKYVRALTRPANDWKGFRGRVTDYLRSLKDDFNWLGTEYYLCGNGDMISEVKTLLHEKGVTKEAIHQEKYY